MFLVIFFSKDYDRNDYDYKKVRTGEANQVRKRTKSFKRFFYLAIFVSFRKKFSLLYLVRWSMVWETERKD